MNVSYYVQVYVYLCVEIIYDGSQINRKNYTKPTWQRSY